MNKRTQIYIVGEYIGDETAKYGFTAAVWEIEGIYETREMADEACTTPNHFMWEHTLNAPPINESHVAMQNVSWPRRQG